METDQAALILNDSTTTDKVWWNCASQFPWEAYHSPRFTEMTKGSEDRWARCAGHNLYEVADRFLTKQQMEAFAADCVERFLMLYRDVLRKDNKLERAIQAMREFAAGKITSQELWDTKKRIEKQSGPLYRKLPTKELEAARDLLRAVLSGAQFTTYIYKALSKLTGNEQAVEAEALWQWNHLMKNYLHETVGARRVAHKGDATEEQISRLVKKDPSEAIKAPAIDPRLFYDLVEDHPVEATLNPAFEMLILEDPGRWKKLLHENVENWLDKAQLFFDVNKSNEENFAFSYDCINRVWPIYEKYAKKKGSPWTDISKARNILRLYIRRGASHEDVTTAEYSIRKLHAQAIQEKADPPTEYNKARLIAMQEVISVFADAFARNIARVAYGVRHAIAYFVFSQTHSRKKSQAAFAEEAIWQWSRAIEYAKGTAKLPRPMAAEQDLALPDVLDHGEQEDPFQRWRIGKNVQRSTKKSGVKQLAHRGHIVGAFFENITIPLSGDESNWQADWNRVKNGFRYLSRPSQYLFAADVAEQLWPNSNNDPELWALIQTVRAYGNGKISKEQIDKAATRANELWYKMQGNPNRLSNTTLAFEAVKDATLGSNIFRNYYLGDWVRPILMKYMQLEANNALLRAESRGLPPMEGQEDLIPVALIIREQAAEKLAQWKNSPISRSKRSVAYINEFDLLFSELVDAKVWIDLSSRWPDSAFGSLVYNRKDSIDSIISDIFTYRPLQEPLELAEEVARDEIKNQWDKIVALLEMKKKLILAWPAKRKEVMGLAPWLREVAAMRRLSGKEEMDIPAFYVCQEPPRRGKIHPVMSLWAESSHAPKKGQLLAFISDEGRLTFS